MTARIEIFLNETRGMDLVVRFGGIMSSKSMDDLEPR